VTFLENQMLDSIDMDSGIDETKDESENDNHLSSRDTEEFNFARVISLNPKF